MQPCLSQSLQAPVSLQILGAFTVPAALPLAVAAGPGCRSQAPLMQPCLSQSLQARRPHSPCSPASHSRCRPQLSQSLQSLQAPASLQTLGVLTVPAALPLTVAAGPSLAAAPIIAHTVAAAQAYDTHASSQRTPNTTRREGRCIFGTRAAVTRITGFTGGFSEV